MLPEVPQFSQFQSNNNSQTIQRSNGPQNVVIASSKHHIDHQKSPKRTPKKASDTLYYEKWKQHPFPMGSTLNLMDQHLAKHHQQNTLGDSDLSGIEENELTNELTNSYDNDTFDSRNKELRHLPDLVFKNKSTLE